MKIWGFLFGLITIRYLKSEEITFYNFSVHHYNLHNIQICIITGWSKRRGKDMKSKGDTLLELVQSRLPHGRVFVDPPPDEFFEKNRHLQT